MTRESSELFHRVAIKGEGDELAREGRRERERRVRGEAEEEEKEKRKRDGGAVTQKRRGERGASKQTLRSFIFLAIIFFREKNPSPFHFVFISVVNASNEMSDLQRCSRQDEPPPLLRFLGSRHRFKERDDV